MVAPIDDNLDQAEFTTIQILDTRTGFHLCTLEREHMMTLFQRALNTWSDAPQQLLSLSDALNKIPD